MTRTSTALALSLVLSNLWGCSSAPEPEPRSASQEAKPASAPPEGEVVKTGEDPSGEGEVLAPATETDTSKEWGILGGPSYARVVDQVVGMVGDRHLRREAHRRGLDIMNVTWEDTGRAQGSVLGPNISDLTLQVRYARPGGQSEATALMPVIRFPNFTDRTGDVPADKFFIRVGNERGQPLRTVPLTKVLSNLRGFLSEPRSVRGSGNLLAKRDSHFLVSAQAVFLPIPQSGKAEFTPVVFNYQSAPGSPAVLTMLVTRQGTSVTVIENRPEELTSRGWGQEIFFNNAGQRAAFTAERKSDVERRIEAAGGPKSDDDRSALAKGADVLFLVQVPLEHAHRGHLGGLPASDGIALEAAPPSAAGAPMKRSASRDRSDVEQAVLGHGRDRGVFVEGNGLRLERDARFPIRITVQFYKATSNGVADASDLDAIAQSIGGVYEHADFVGSLVVPEGDPARPTAWQTMPAEWFPW